MDMSEKGNVKMQNRYMNIGDEKDRIMLEHLEMT